MQAIQMIMHRTMWAGCFCLALTLYHGPTRTLPLKLGEATEPDQGIGVTHLAQRLGTEVGSMMKSQRIYVLTQRR